MKIIECITVKILQKTVDLQKKQIKTYKGQIKSHERLLKTLMQELGYPSWKISATILANYKNVDWWQRYLSIRITCGFLWVMVASIVQRYSCVRKNVSHTKKYAKYLIESWCTNANIAHKYTNVSIILLNTKKYVKQ